MGGIDPILILMTVLLVLVVLFRHLPTDEVELSLGDYILYHLVLISLIFYIGGFLWIFCFLQPESCWHLL